MDFPSIQKMSDDMLDAYAPIQRDSISLNVAIQSLSRLLVFIGGIISSTILVRAISANQWTTPDYSHLRVLMNWNQILTVFVVMGLATAIIKYVSEFSHDREKVGTVLTISFIAMTLTFLVIAFATLFLTEQMASGFGFLVGETQAITNELRVLWVIVLLSILPSAYLLVCKSVFSGIQRMKRTLIVDIVYNASRIAILIILFLLESVSILNILYMYLATTIAGFIAAGLLLRRELRFEGIRLHLKGWRVVVQPLFKISVVFAALAFIATFFNSIVPLFVDYYGTDFDMARYSTASNISQTLRGFLYAPFAVLLPNISQLSSIGDGKEIRDRFQASNRVIVPALIFAFGSVFAFSESILGTLYGVWALDTTGGISATQFLMILSPSLLIIPITGVYTNILTALNKMKPILIIGIAGVIIQTLWIVLLQPHFGVIIIAFSWIIFIPLLVTYHLYSRKQLKLNLTKGFIIRSIVLTGLFVVLAVSTFQLARGMINLLSFVSFFQYTTIRSGVELLFIIPLWYIFIGLALVCRVMGKSDIETLKKFLKKIPPAWWVSKPFFTLLDNYATGQEMQDKTQETPDAVFDEGEV